MTANELIDRIPESKREFALALLTAIQATCKEYEKTQPQQPRPQTPWEMYQAAGQKN